MQTVKEEKICTNEMPNYIRENPADMPETNQEPERNRLKTTRASENNQIDTEQHYKEEEQKNYAQLIYKLNRELSMDKNMSIDNEEEKKHQMNCKTASMENMREIDNDVVKKAQTNRKRLSLNKNRAEDYSNTVLKECVNCKNCNWTGGRNALLKHLRMKSICKLQYNMDSLYAEQANNKKQKKKDYNKMHYRNNKERKKQHYLERKEEKKQNYQEKKVEMKKQYQENKEERKNYQRCYYQKNKEDRKQYQRSYDETHKERKKKYRKLKAHYKRQNYFWEVGRMDHFQEHSEGWCNDWTVGFDHDCGWVRANKECTTCNGPMFQLKIKEWGRRIKLNSIHCISCSKIACDLCGKEVHIHKFYHHFYVKGINQHLEEKAALCPYKQVMNVEGEKREHFPCEICPNVPVTTKEVVNMYGIKRNIKHITCPFIDDSIQSTVCLLDAVKKLAKKVNSRTKCNKPDYIDLSYRIAQSTHKEHFEKMCELQKHLDLHLSKRVQSHVIEVKLKIPYKTIEDLKMIDAMLKFNIENHPQVSRIKSITPAETCLGFKDHYIQHNTQPAWLASCNPMYLNNQISCNPDSNYWKDLDIEEINSEMNKMKGSNKLLYMTVLTHEHDCDNIEEYLEMLSLHLDWIENTKQLYKWSVKGILEETNRAIQEALITGKFIQSKKYPNYGMNLVSSQICGCDCCHRFDITGIDNRRHTIPVDGCPLPITVTPNHMRNKSKKREIPLWEEMFKYEWNGCVETSDTDSLYSSEEEEVKKDSSTETTDYESDDWIPEEWI